MNIEFNTQEELYKRVMPALKSKRCELKRYGYDIKEKEIWSFLVSKFFSKSIGLTLADVVSSIMHVDIYELNQYVKTKLINNEE